MCHETIRGRNSEDVASGQYNVLKRLKENTKHLIFWTDSSTAQNKHWAFFTSCIILVNEEWSPESITFKYFKPGHSFIEKKNGKNSGN